MRPLDAGETIPPPHPNAGEATEEPPGFASDDERVARYVRATTGLDDMTVRACLRSRERYHLGLGAYREELAQEGETPEGIRADHPDLFPPHNVTWRFIDPRLEAEYIAIDTGMADADVRRILTAVREYTRRGIIG